MKMYNCPDCLIEDSPTLDDINICLYCKRKINDNTKVIKFTEWEKGITEVPFIPSYITVTPCDNCLNNPKNGGLGTCHCILGRPAIYCNNTTGDIDNEM